MDRTKPPRERTNTRAEDGIPLDVAEILVGELLSRSRVVRFVLTVSVEKGKATVDEPARFRVRPDRTTVWDGCHRTSTSLVVDRCASFAHVDVASKDVLAHASVDSRNVMRPGRTGRHVRGVRCGGWPDVAKEGWDEAVRKLDGS